MPNTIADNLHRLKATVPAIRNSIITKGGTVNAGDGLEEFAADVMSIKNDLTSIDITENGTYYSGDETVVTSSTFPVVVVDSNGTPVRHVDINGNAVQSGTPTSDNPIMPQGTGERTGNLFRGETKLMIDSDGTVTEKTSVISSIIDVTDYDWISLNIDLDLLNNNLFRIGRSTQPIVTGSTVIRTVQENGAVDVRNYNYLLVACSYSAVPSSSPEKIMQSIMANVGSTALPYEPYGYKLDISSSNTTTSVYLGEVETTRQIKKLVLTGDEPWGKSENGICSYFIIRLGDSSSTFTTAICTHYENVDVTQTSPAVGFMLTASSRNLRIRTDDVENVTLNDFTSYLAAQYAAGTPVTVWYVLAESETGIVNEPLMKIGDYADSLSVDVELPLSQNTQNNIDVNTTLKPSSASFTYNRLSEYIGYNEINVDVSNTYTAEDEGKVVNNATLIPQTSMPTGITINGTYDTTLYNSIVVNVPDIVGHTFIVATIPNAVVTVTNASNTYTETADNVGEALFKSVAAGTYNVTATYDDAVSDTTSITIADHTVTEDSFAKLTISASDNTTITVTDGTVTKTLTYTGTPIVQYVSLGSWDLSCTIDDTVITRTVLVDSYTNQNIYLAPPAPSVVVTRTVDFVNNVSTLDGDVNTLNVYSNMKRCNVADNGTINAYDGDLTYTEDGSNGQVMVKVNKFYYKLDVSQTGDLNGVNIRKGRWSISDTPDTGFKLHPAFLAADGVTELDYFLYGAFDAVGQDSNGTYSTSYNTTAYKLGSVGGNTYAPTNSLTRATARTMATNRGAGWYQAGVKQTMALQMLFAVECGFNSQLSVGYGVVGASAASKTGITIGSTTSGTKDNQTTPVNWRGIENLWGNIWNWIDGLNINNRVPYVCDTFTFVDDTFTGYTQIGFSIPSQNAYVSALGYDANNDWIMLPSEATGANENSAIGDYVYSNTGWRVACLGGGWSDAFLAGLFYWSLSNVSLNAGSARGSRLMFIPTTSVQ